MLRLDPVTWTHHSPHYSSSPLHNIPPGIYKGEPNLGYLEFIIGNRGLAAVRLKPGEIVRLIESLVG